MNYGNRDFFDTSLKLHLESTKDEKDKKDDKKDDSKKGKK